MSLQPQPVGSVPQETIRVARAAFPRDNVYRRIRDTLGSIYTDDAFAALFPTRGQPAEAPWRLALVTVMQFAEGLPDRQAAEAVCSRIDWKYALGLALDDPGFAASVLCEFRARLVAGGAEDLLLDPLLAHCRAQGLLKARGRQRTDSTHVLAAIRVLNRLECVGETLRHALNAVAGVAPEWLRSWVPSEWLRSWVPSEWLDRYGRPFNAYRLPPGRTERYALAARMGADGFQFQLLAVVYDPRAPLWVREVPAVQTLRRVWLQRFYAPTPQVQWRSAEDLPPASLLIGSPYDPEARYGKKRETEWSGYKVHLSETCDADTPHLITTVETTDATISDCEMTTTIHEHLAARAVLPAKHFLDAGYVTADHRVASRREHGVELIGPVPNDNSWQAKAQHGFDSACFSIDWDARRAVPARADECAVDGAPRPARAGRRPHPFCAGRGPRVSRSCSVDAGDHGATHVDDPGTGPL